MSAPFLRLSGITKRYEDRIAVNGVSLDLAAGESMVVVGPSGCGKTTVLRLIAGLERADAGEIWLDGQRVAAPGRNIAPPHSRRVGFVFQDMALWPHLTVRGNLDFVMGAVSVPKTERAARTHEVLNLLRIEALSHRYPHQLSGGEQQRAALARTLVGRPRLLLLDEPFSSLDPDLRVALRGEFVRLQRQLHLTSIYVTHDVDDASTLGDRVVVMRDGRVESIRVQAPLEEPR